MVESLERRQTTDVRLVWYPKGKGGKQAAIWSAKLTLLDYMPRAECYYALVKVMEDRIFIFFVWNGHHCTINKQTGRILKKGEGDDALKEYDRLVPLKLAINVPSSGQTITMTKEEVEELEKEKMEVEAEWRARSGDRNSGETPEQSSRKKQGIP